MNDPIQNISVTLPSLNLADMKRTLIEQAVELRLNLIDTSKVLGLTRRAARRELDKHNLTLHEPLARLQDLEEENG